jgi:AcrR family transcriptional regulator
MCSAKAGSPSRPYRKTRRAESEAETRTRIVEATVALHETVGPARTTVKAIAQRAGVQRATVYKHFPDLQTLFDACTAHYYERHPMPDPGRWASIDPPAERFSIALGELYAWYEETEQMLTVGIRDIDAIPPAAREAFVGYFDQVRDVLVAGRRERGRARTKVSGAIGHATSFGTWRSLVREQSLTTTEAVSLMAATVGAAAKTRDP